MDTGFLITALGLISAATVLTVEGFKMILDSTGKTYNSTILAVIISFVLSTLSCVGYIVYNEISFTPKIGVEAVVLIFLSFLCSTVGYDKVIKELFKR